MSGISNEILFDVTKQVFEEAAFVFLEMNDEIEDWEEDMVQVIMSFQSPESEGRMVLSASNEFTIELAANMLGMDEDDETVLDKGKAAIGEILNMICGVMMERLYGDEVICKLGLPETQDFEVDQFEEFKQTAESYISLAEEMGARIDAAFII